MHEASYKLDSDMRNIKKRVRGLNNFEEEDEETRKEDLKIINDMN